MAMFFRDTDAVQRQLEPAARELLCAVAQLQALCPLNPKRRRLRFERAIEDWSPASYAVLTRQSGTSCPSFRPAILIGLSAIVLTNRKNLAGPAMSAMMPTA